MKLHDLCETGPGFAHPSSLSSSSSTAAQRLLRLPAVLSRTGLGRSTVYIMIAQDRFPQPVRLNKRAIGFREEQVDAWINSRLIASRSERIGREV